MSLEEGPYHIFTKGGIPIGLLAILIGNERTLPEGATGPMVALDKETPPPKWNIVRLSATTYRLFTGEYAPFLAIHVEHGVFGEKDFGEPGENSEWRIDMINPQEGSYTISRVNENKVWYVSNRQADQIKLEGRGGSDEQHFIFKKLN